MIFKVPQNGEPPSKDLLFWLHTELAGDEWEGDDHGLIIRGEFYPSGETIDTAVIEESGE